MNVMIIDDTLSNLELFQDVLENDFSVFSFLDPNEALSKISQIKPDLILLDYVLPEVLGHVVLQKIKTDFPNIPVIIISGFRVEDYAIESLESMADDFIYKPILEEELIARIKNKIQKFQKHKLDNELYFSFDDSNEMINVQNKNISLKGKEYKLFKYLYQNKNQLVSREDIFSNVWEDTFVSPATLDTHLCQLRKKLDSYGERVVTRKNSGFLFSTIDI